METKELRGLCNADVVRALDALALIDGEDRTTRPPSEPYPSVRTVTVRQLTHEFTGLARLYAQGPVE